MKSLRLTLLVVSVASLASAAATQPSSRPATTLPADAALSDILGLASDAPSTRPAATSPGSKPVSPFADRKEGEVRAGVIILSSGEKIRGKIATTAGKPLRVWDKVAKAYHDIPFALIASVEAKVLWERDEAEWKFKESGSDIKEYSGKTYPTRELQCTFTLANGETVTGGVVAPLYLQTADGRATFVLNKRQKGEVGTTLKQLVYVSRLELE